MKVVNGRPRSRRSGTVAGVIGTAIAFAVLTVLLGFAEDRAEAKTSESPETGGPATPSREQTIVKKGRMDPGGPDWVYEPFEVPEGVTGISVKYDYNRTGNALDIGIFDPDGYGLGNTEGFRGWSGGARSEFTISRSGATPGYIPGDIEPGTWNIIFGPYQVAPGGIDWTATITLRYGEPGPAFEPRPTPIKAQGRGPGWYRGDLHLHTTHSDGRYTPGEVVSGASSAGLDFMVSSEHNTPTASLVWGEYARPDLLIMNGEEVTTRAGHYNALGLEPGQWIDWRYLPVDGQLPRFLKKVQEDGGLAMANHPFCPFKGCDWRFGYKGMDAIEVWNGPWTPDDEAAVKLWDGMLREGRTVPTATGASDAHRAGQKIGLPQTVVRADRLKQTSILAGIKAGRAYVAESDDVALDMSAAAGRRRAGIGERLPSGPGSPVEVSLRVQGAPGAVATFHTRDGVVKTAPIPDGDQTVTFRTRARDSRYVRAEVRRPDGAMVALTNPIFVGRE